MKILIGIDDSKVSGDVLRAMVTQFRTEHTEVRVLHVLQPIVPAPPQMAPGYAPELEDQKKPGDRNRACQCCDGTDHDHHNGRHC